MIEIREANHSGQCRNTKKLKILILEGDRNNYVSLVYLSPQKGELHGARGASDLQIKVLESGELREGCSPVSAQDLI